MVMCMDVKEGERGRMSGEGDGEDDGSGGE